MRGRQCNHPAAGKAGIVSLLAIGHHWPGLPEPARSADASCMRRSFIIGLGLFVMGLCGFGCASRPEYTTQLDRAQALESALRYTFDKFDQHTRNGPSKYWEYVIADGELASRLVAAFHDHSPPVVGYAARSPARNWFIWSAAIQAKAGGHATIYVRFSQFPGPGGGGYILELHCEKQRWLVDSEKWSQTGS